MALSHKEKGTYIKLHIKAVAMIDPLTGWFEITDYNNNRVVAIENLVETTWLSRYPRPTEITHDQG